MMLNEIEKLIGEHPKKSSLFATWLIHDDKIIPTIPISKKHRCLDENKTYRQTAIDEIALKLIKHHISEKALFQIQRTKKRELYGKYNFNQFVDSQGLLPFDNFNTQKGNLTEVIFSEYLQEISKLKCLIYKLRYNSNSTQSMKGDDVLLFNIDNLREKIIVGESKYRTTPNGTAIEEILDGFSDHKSKTPISVTFVSNMLREANQTKLANKISYLQCELYNEKDIPVILVGFILSNRDVHKEVSSHDLFSDYSINQRVIHELNSFHKPFPTNLSPLIGRTFTNEAKLREAIDKLIDKDKTYSSSSISAIDKGINGYGDRVKQSKDIDQNLITDLQILGLPVCNWTSVNGKRANNDNINSVLKNQLNKTINEIDKGYWKTILDYSDKSNIDKLVCITFGVDDPKELINKIFAKANKELYEIENLDFEYTRTFAEFTADMLDLDELDLASVKKKVKSFMK